MIDPGIDDKRLLLDEREFFSALEVMKREGNIVSRVIRDAWDCLARLGRYQEPANPRRPTPSSRSSATSPSMSCAQTLDQTSMANGYANRFLFCLRPPQQDAAFWRRSWSTRPNWRHGPGTCSKRPA